MKSDNPDIKRLLGTEGNYGEQLGLTKDWAYQHHQARRQLRRDLREERRAGLAAKIARGVNALWTKGGLQYAPPIR